MRSCPRCYSSDLTRDGHDQRGRPIHACGACGRHATRETDELLEILFQLDPIGVHANNTEKFVPELATILPRLRDARSPEDVEQIIQEELRRWYGRRRLANQDPERLTDATLAICSALNRFLDSSAQ